MTEIKDQNINIGDKILITTDNWFLAPDGESYRAVWGTLNAIHDSTEMLGVKTNSKSTNWYVSVGNMVVAGCQIHYVIKTDKISNKPPTREIETSDGKLKTRKTAISRIYKAE